MLLTAIFLVTISPYSNEAVLFQSTCGVLFLVTGLAGLGMYEANAIQFGMDQMLEASSEQLSSFIHWYFWCVHTGPLIVFLLCNVHNCISSKLQIHLQLVRQLCFWYTTADNFSYSGYFMYDWLSLYEVVKQAFMH